MWMRSVTGALLALCVAIFLPVWLEEKEQFGDGMETMKAVRYHAFGPTVDVLQLEDGVVLPKYGRHDVVVRVRAAALNPVDAKRAKGMLAWLDSLRGSLPLTTCLDFAGVVVAVGEAAREGLAVGDHVMGMRDPMAPGALAEYTVLPAAHVTHKPAGVSFAAAAAVPLVGLTILQALDSAGLAAGHHVLILGGTTATGMVATQLAKRAGAHVTVTCSAASEGLVRSLGADAVLDYRDPGHAAALRALSGIDRVIDCVGPPDAWEVATALLPPSGVFVYITIDGGSKLTPGFLARAAATLAWRGLLHLLGRGPLALPIAVSPNSAQLQRLAELVDAGHLRVPVDSEYALADFADAFNRLEGGRCKGKVVLNVQ